MDLQEYVSLVGQYLQFNGILGQGSHGLAVQITDLRSAIIYAMKIGYRKDCLVDDGGDYNYQQEYTVGKLMGELGLGPVIYKFGCVTGGVDRSGKAASTPSGVDRSGKAASTPSGVDRSGKAASTRYNYPYIIMELFETDCDIARDYAIRTQDVPLLTYIYKECIYMIKSMARESQYFTDVKTGNFVIKNFRNNGLPNMKMIDFDEQYKLPPASKDTKKMLPILLIIQIFFMNLGRIIDTANPYLQTYINIFSRYLRKYMKNYMAFSNYIDATPILKRRLEWYLQENVFKYVDQNIFKNTKGDIITGVSEQISLAIYEVFPKSVINSFGRSANEVRGRSKIGANEVRGRSKIGANEVRGRSKIGALRVRRSINFAVKRRSKQKAPMPTLRVEHITVRDDRRQMTRLCRIFKNVPTFVDNPNNDKPTIYKTIDELLPAVRPSVDAMLVLR